MRLVMKCGSSFSLLVEMADQRPGARQGCQSSLSKSCVALHFEARSKSGDSVSTAPLVFSPDEARIVFFLLICSFTLFHFSLPSSFHLINKHTLQPTFIEQLGSSVPSHFLTIHRVL